MLAVYIFQRLGVEAIIRHIRLGWKLRLSRIRYIRLAT